MQATAEPTGAFGVGMEKAVVTATYSVAFGVGMAPEIALTRSAFAEGGLAAAAKAVTGWGQTALFGRIGAGVSDALWQAGTAEPTENTVLDSWEDIKGRFSKKVNYTNVLAQITIPLPYTSALVGNATSIGDFFSGQETKFATSLFFSGLGNQISSGLGSLFSGGLPGKMTDFFSGFLPNIQAGTLTAPVQTPFNADLQDNNLSKEERP